MDARGMEWNERNCPPLHNCGAMTSGFVIAADSRGHDGMTSGGAARRICSLASLYSIVIAIGIISILK
jgi:hypothetical protein